MPKKGDCSDCSGDGWAMREGGKSGTHKLRRCRTCNMDKKTPKPRYTIRMGGGSYEGDELQEVLKGDGHTLLAHGVAPPAEHVPVVPRSPRATLTRDEIFNEIGAMDAAFEDQHLLNLSVDQMRRSGRRLIERLQREELRFAH